MNLKVIVIFPFFFFFFAVWAKVMLRAMLIFALWTLIKKILYFLRTLFGIATYFNCYCVCTHTSLYVCMCVCVCVCIIWIRTHVHNKCIYLCKKVFLIKAICFFSYYFIFYWSIVDLQCFVSFSCIAAIQVYSLSLSLYIYIYIHIYIWYCHTHTYVCIYSLFQSFPHRLL